MDIIEKIRRARESAVQIGDITIRFSRPTDLDAQGMKFDDLRQGVEGISKFVIGWDGVTEAHLIPNGSDQKIDFSPEVFSEWIKDNPQAWGVLVEAVLNAYTKHREDKEKAGNA